MIEAVSYASRVSEVSGGRLRNSITYNEAAADQYSSVNALPVKQERFNEQVIDSRSALSRLNR